MQKQGSVQRGIDGLARERVPGPEKKKKGKESKQAVPQRGLLTKFATGKPERHRATQEQRDRKGGKGTKRGTQREIRDRRAAFPPARLGVCLFSFGGYV